MSKIIIPGQENQKVTHLPNVPKSAMDADFYFDPNYQRDHGIREYFSVYEEKHAQDILVKILGEKYVPAETKKGVLFDLELRDHCQEVLREDFVDLELRDPCQEVLREDFDNDLFWEILKTEPSQSFLNYCQEMYPYNAIGPHVVIYRWPIETQIRGSKIVAVESKVKTDGFSDRGIVVSSGDGCFTEDSVEKIKPGDGVHINMHKGTSYYCEGGALLLYQLDFRNIVGRNKGQYNKGQYV